MIEIKRKSLFVSLCLCIYPAARYILTLFLSIVFAVVLSILENLYKFNIML